MNHRFLKIIVAVTLLLSFILGLGASAATAAAAKTAAPAPAKLQYGAWLPFWQAQSGQKDVAIHLASLDEISLFSYEIGNNGALIDSLKIGSGIWDGWMSAVRDMGVKIIPTIAWFDASGIQKLLSNGTTRRAEENKITQLVTSNKFDGIDIDFEAMYPRTQPYYSLFIEGLALRLHPLGKKLTCTVVPRAPLDSLYAVVPTSTVTYAENYAVLNKYCDEVRLMAYDQQTTDIQLNASKGGNGTLYAPVADPDWVRKVIKVALRSISPKKIMLGAPTYGYEYQVSWANGQTTYERVRAFNYLDAMDRAVSLGITPVRDNAGELSFTFASSTHIAVAPILTARVSSTQPSVLMNPNPNASTTFFVSFPDAQSELDKVKLAQEYGLKGVVFFKADGGMDPAIWNVITSN